MTQAMRQPSVLPDGDWLPLDQAARLTGGSIRTLQRRASWELRSARQAGRQTLARKALPTSGKGKPVWYVHRSFDPTLARCVDKSTREDRSRTALADRFPQHKVEQAYRKAHWLRQWRSLCDGRRIGNVTEVQLAERIVREAKQTEGRDFPISMRSLQLWHGAYYATGVDGQIRGVEGLVDRRGVEDQGDGKSTDARDPQAVEYFYQQFHCQSKLTVKTCHELTRRRAKQKGWSWSASYSAVRNWLQTHDDLSLTCLLRDGRDAWQHRYMPHIEMDYTQIEPGDLFVCDHAQCDFWIEHQGKQLRPWLTAIQDARTRCIVGWHLGIAPHQDSILAAMRMAFKDWAIPEVIRIDNGRDWTSKLLTGITKHTRNRLRREYGANWRSIIQHSDSLIDCGVDPRFMGIIQELGIELIYAIPYAPWSKMIERFFGTFHDQCGKTFATYCGNSTLRRPECLEAIRRGYTKDQKRSYRKRYGREWKKVVALRFVDRSDVPSLEAARNPQPLFSLEDIRKLIKQSDLKLSVSPDAIKWLQDRASSLGCGGIGHALICLYLAYKLAFVKGDEAITALHMEDVADMAMGHEDAERIAEVVAESSGMKRVV